MLTYLLELSVCWILLYVIFFLCMRRETFFKINRWYLLTALILGLAIPLLRFIPIMEEVELYNQQIAEYAPIFYVIKDTPAIVAHTITEQSIQWGQVFQFSLLALYSLGFAFFLFRFIKGIISINNLYHDGDKTINEKYTLINTSGNHLPFSFLNMIFVNRDLPLNQDYNRIITHELEHVRSWHSIDVLLLEFINIIFWFHPMIYLYKSALRQTHEYLADAAVCGTDSRQLYGQLLLRQSLSGLEIALAHHFFHSHIKKRINMIYQEKSGRKAWLKYALAVPVLALLMLVFTSQTTAKVPSDLLKENQSIINEDPSKFPEKKLTKEVKRILEKEINDEEKIAQLESLYQKWLIKYPKENVTIKDVMSWTGPINRRRIWFNPSEKLTLMTPSHYLPGYHEKMSEVQKVELSNRKTPTYENIEMHLKHTYETTEITFLHNYLRWQGFYHLNKDRRTEIHKLFIRYAEEHDIDLGFDLKDLKIQYNATSPKLLKKLIDQKAQPVFWGSGLKTQVFAENFNFSTPIGMFAYLSPGNATKLFGKDGKEGFVAMSHYTFSEKHPSKMKEAFEREVKNFFSTIDQLPEASWINKLKEVQADLSLKYGDVNDYYDPITPFSNIAHQHNITLVFKKGKIIKAYRGDGNSSHRIDTDTKKDLPQSNINNSDSQLPPLSAQNDTIITFDPETFTETIDIIESPTYNSISPTVKEVRTNTYGNINEAMDLINSNDSSIFQVGRFFALDIKNASERIIQDNTLEHFWGLASTLREKHKITAALKEKDIKYILIDLYTHTLDETPDKSLTKRYQLLLNILYKNADVKLLATDRVIEITHENGTKSRVAEVFGEDIKNFGSYAIFEIL